METLKALRGADNADGMVFSGLSGVQRTQWFGREHMVRELQEIRQPLEELG